MADILQELTPDAERIVVGSLVGNRNIPVKTCWLVSGRRLSSSATCRLINATLKPTMCLVRYQVSNNLQCSVGCSQNYKEKARDMRIYHDLWFSYYPEEYRILG